MKIVIYSSTNSGYINEYNISNICNFFSSSEIIILRVDNSAELSLYSKIKRIAYEKINGPNYFKIDNKKISSSIIGLKQLKIKSVIKEIRVKQVNDKKSEELIKSFSPDIIVQAGAGILKENIFRLSRLGTINLHHGFSPEIRGMNSTFWCLYYGLYSKLGVTCHFIDKGIDTGAVICQYLYPFKKGDSFVDIQKHIIIQGSKILNKSIAYISDEGTSFKYHTSEVDSYYFGKINFLDYNKLRKNKYNRVEYIDNSKKRIFKKKILIT